MDGARSGFLDYSRYTYRALPIRLYIIFSGGSRGGSRAETPPELHHVSCAESRRFRTAFTGGDLEI